MNRPARTWRVWTNASPDGPRPTRYYVLLSGQSTDDAERLVEALKAAGWDASREREDDEA